MWMELFVLPSLENFIGVFRNTRMSLRSRLITGFFDYFVSCSSCMSRNSLFLS